MHLLKAERRMYDVIISIGKSASVGEGRAKVISLGSVAFVTSALGKL